jgi:hypothetical protein
VSQHREDDPERLMMKVLIQELANATRKSHILQKRENKKYIPNTKLWPVVLVLTREEGVIIEQDVKRGSFLMYYVGVMSTKNCAHCYRCLYIFSRQCSPLDRLLVYRIERAQKPQIEVYTFNF